MTGDLEFPHGAFYAVYKECIREKFLTDVGCVLKMESTSYWIFLLYLRHLMHFSTVNHLYYTYYTVFLSIYVILWS